MTDRHIHSLKENKDITQEEMFAANLQMKVDCAMIPRYGSFGHVQLGMSGLISLIDIATREEPLLQDGVRRRRG